MAVIVDSPSQLQFGFNYRFWNFFADVCLDGNFVFEDVAVDSAGSFHAEYFERGVIVRLSGQANSAGDGITGTIYAYYEDCAVEVEGPFYADL